MEAGSRRHGRSLSQPYPQTYKTRNSSRMASGEVADFPVRTGQNQAWKEVLGRRDGREARTGRCG